MEVNKRVQDLGKVFDRNWNVNKNNHYIQYLFIFILILY